MSKQEFLIEFAKLHKIFNHIYCARLTAAEYQLFLEFSNKHKDFLLGYEMNEYVLLKPIENDPWWLDHFVRFWSATRTIYYKIVHIPNEEEFNVLYSNGIFTNVVCLNSVDMGGKEQFEKIKKAMEMFNYPKRFDLTNAVSDEETKSLLAIAILVFGVEIPLARWKFENPESCLPEEFHSIVGIPEIMEIYKSTNEIFNMKKSSSTAPLLFKHHLPTQ